jgi:hypothetical protein
VRSVGGDPACSVPFLERLRRARNASPVSDDHDRLERQGPQVACAPGSDTPVREAESFGPAHESEGSLSASRSGGKASHWGAEPLFKPGVALPGSIDHSISCVPAPAIAEVCFGRPGCALNRPTWSPIKAVPLAFPLSAQLSLSGNDFFGIFWPVFWPAPTSSSATLLVGRAGNGWARLLRCGRDRSGGGFPNARYEPASVMRRLSLNRSEPDEKSGQNIPKKSLPDNNS